MRNASKLLAAGGKVITPFAWSAEALSAAGLDARWVGHPIVDIAKPMVDRATFLRELELDESRPVIGLLPGSRGHELTEHLPPMLGCAEIMNRELGGAQFVVAVVGSDRWVRERVAAAGRREPFDFAQDRPRPPIVRVVEGRTYDCMAACDLLISKSGTATLEAAVIGTPMVIVYRGTPVMRLEYRLRKGELEEFIGMPNIVADRGVCPELISEDVTAEKVAGISLSILRDEGTLMRMRESLAEVKRSLGEPGAVERAARAVLEMGGLT
jgi:lipid-A-disaccharide synthase